MRHVIRLSAPGVLAVLLAAGCTIPPPPGSARLPSAEVVPADAHTAVHGATLADVLRDPALGEKIRIMFGPDWTGGILAPPGASGYFVSSGPPSEVRIAGVDYIAYRGCLSGRCESRRLLLLIQKGGSDMLARLDEGGFSHYYAFGGLSREAAQVIADSGMRALQRSSRMS
jgi:hypothetical protein